MDLARMTAVIDDAGRRIAEAAARPMLAVPSCPGWRVADLVWHVGVVAGFWRQLVDGSLPGPAGFHPGERPDDADLVDWWSHQLASLSAALAGADPAAEVWTWSQDHTVGFVQRRMTHELAVHAWDADAASGRTAPVAVDVAIDGIDELLAAFLFRVPVPERFAAGDVLHLHTTDAPPGSGPGEWLVGASTDGWWVERHHAKGAFAGQGPASDLLLAVWGRLPLERLTTFGDRSLFDSMLTGLQASMGGPRSS